MACGTGISGCTTDVGDHSRGDPAHRRRRRRPIPAGGPAGDPAEAADGEQLGHAGVRETGTAATPSVARRASSHGGGRPSALRRDRRHAFRSRSGGARRRIGDAGPRCRRTRPIHDRPRAPRSVHDPARRRARHHRDGPVVGTGTTYPAPHRAGESRCRRGCFGGRRPVGRRIPRTPSARRPCGSAQSCSTSVAS